jgi:putative Ca2+/H+ antiporter (TMEM165/GDT1 family)
MQPFLVSTALVALAEIGDKTQLLSLVLAARYRAPVPIILGILAATLANHGIAAGLGDLLARTLDPSILNWAIVASFVAMGLWMLVPDRLDDEQLPRRSAHGVFLATGLAFFLAEMGDKTQVATIALAARFHEWAPVVVGTTLGMLVANVPAVLFGHKFADRLPSRWIHAVAAILFVVLGGFALHAALQPH